MCDIFRLILRIENILRNLIQFYYKILHKYLFIYIRSHLVVNFI